jgi:AmiR/NasT family two-component response regulator
VPTRGALAGIWDGRQLSESEAHDLTAFCTQMSHDGASVITLLDFPRRDRADYAYEIGAAAVVGKPWFNADLVATLKAISSKPNQARAA